MKTTVIEVLLLVVGSTIPLLYLEEGKAVATKAAADWQMEALITITSGWI